MSLRFLGFWAISITRNYNQILSFKLCNVWVVTVSRNYISILSFGLLDFATPCNCHVTGEAQYLRPVRCPSYLNDNARMHKKFDALRVTLWPWGLHQMDMHLTTDLTIISTKCLQLDLWKMSKTLQHYATWVTLKKMNIRGFVQEIVLLFYSYSLLLLIDLYPSPHRGYHWTILKQCWIMTSVRWIFFSAHSQNTIRMTIFLGTQMLNLQGGLDSRSIENADHFCLPKYKCKIHGSNSKAH